MTGGCGHSCRVLLSRKQQERSLIAKNSARPLLISVLIWLLCACDGGEGLRSSNTAAAQRLPAGELSLPFGAFDAGVSTPPSVLYRLFDGLEIPGVQMHLVELDEQPALLLLELDLGVFEAVLVGTDGGRRPGLSAGEAIDTFGLDLVVGSSFVSELHSLTPVGLLQIEGAVISKLQGHGYTRVLGVRPDGLGVVASREYHRGMFESAMQVGPGVVEQGLLDISERDLERPKFFRTFVATCGTSVMIGASQVPMHLYTLGQRLLEFVAEIGQSCDEVVNLAGDREVVLAAANRSTMVYFGHPQTSKAALLGFRRRQ
jgi:hypothetical protein